MTGFLRAHGYDPGPTQRPVLAGFLSGILATLPATGVLKLFGSLKVEADILDLPLSTTLALGCTAMALAGAAYGRLFQRAANDRRGGWLFGAAFGFLLWMAGAVLILPLVSGGIAPAGRAAVGLYLSLVLWGASTGALFPYVHRPLHLSADRGYHQLGPTAATKAKQFIR
jgi:hypothetical protein